EHERERGGAKRLRERLPDDPPGASLAEDRERGRLIARLLQPCPRHSHGHEREHRPEKEQGEKGERKRDRRAPEQSLWPAAVAHDTYHPVAALHGFNQRSLPSPISVAVRSFGRLGSCANSCHSSGR